MSSTVFSVPISSSICAFDTISGEHDRRHARPVAQLARLVLLSKADPEVEAVITGFLGRPSAGALLDLPEGLRFTGVAEGEPVVRLVEVLA